jgi:uncharacterized protein involved in exopolysaccharide biosynthesis
MNEIGIAKLRGVVRRRRIPILVAVVGVLGVSIAILSQVPPQYKANAVIRATEVQPAKDYVPPIVAEQIGERLKSLRLTVMARPIVAEAAKNLGLFTHSKQSPEAVVDDIRSRMDVKLEGEDTYLLTYSDPSPERAKAIVNQVAALFMKNTVERREQVASATTQALKAEVDALKPELDQAEKAVRDFKVAHYGALPEQEEGNLRTLDQTTMEINIQSTNLDADQERRRLILTSAMSPLRHQEETLASALYAARTHYTDDNPEVATIRAEYNKVKASRIAEEKELLARTRRANPELIAIEGEIGRSKAILAGLRERQTEFRKRVQATAANGQGLAVLSSRYDGLKDKYGMTLSHLRDAQLAERIEHGLSSLRFDLVEGASLPTGSASLNRPLMAAAALVVALLAGLGLGFALDAADDKIRDAEQVRQAAPETPILACVPHTSFRAGSGPKAEA